MNCTELKDRKLTSFSSFSPFTSLSSLTLLVGSAALDEEHHNQEDDKIRLGRHDLSGNSQEGKVLEDSSTYWILNHKSCRLFIAGCAFFSSILKV